MSESEDERRRAYDAYLRDQQRQVFEQQEIAARVAAEREAQAAVQAELELLRLKALRVGVRPSVIYEDFEVPKRTFPRFLKRHPELAAAQGLRTIEDDQKRRLLLSIAAAERRRRRP